MKRKSLTIGLVILIIIGIWIITYLFNNYMVNNNNTFNIYITKDSKKINDCEIILLNNIGYKIVITIRIRIIIQKLFSTITNLT